MATVLLLIHLMLAAALVGVVLLQKSEGGALGIGGGGGGGGFMTGRGTANFLTRVTAGLALAFFLTSLGLTMLAQRNASQGSVFDRASPPAATLPADGNASGTKPAAPAAPPSTGGVLGKLRGSEPAVPPSK
ncbi:MAG: preprotein translocase subunit SecG [Hyphomicrobiaceae bacterium]